VNRAVRLILLMCYLAVAVTLVSCGGRDTVTELSDPVTSLQTAGNAGIESGDPDSLPTPDGADDLLDNREENWDDFTDEDITIVAQDINETLKITIPARGEMPSASFDSKDIEKIIIPTCDDGGRDGSLGYYEVKFWLTPDGIKKAGPAVSYLSDFPIDISINEKTFKYFTSDEYKYHHSRSFSSIVTG